MKRLKQPYGKGEGSGVVLRSEGGREEQKERKRGEGRRGRGRWGFDPLEGISKYITFKGSKGRDLL